MAKYEKKTYIVGMCCSEADGVRLSKVIGTEDQMKKYLARCVRDDRDADKESFDNGTTAAKDIDVSKNGELNGYGTYSDYHIDYTAKPEMEPIIL